MQIFISLRYKILFSLLLGITVVVGVITFSMANLFHKDKTTYIYDLISNNALQTAIETQTLLQDYVERAKTLASVAYDTNITQGEKSRMLDDLFQAFPEMLTITFYENGVKQASVLDELGLAEVGLSKADLDSEQLVDLVSLTALEPEKVVIRNSRLPARLPVMAITTTLTIPGWESPFVLEALVRTDDLLALVGRSEHFESFILEPGGSLLVHTDPEEAKTRDFKGWLPEKSAWPEQSGLAETIEYTVDGIHMIGGFSRVELGKLMVGVQIPRAAAFLSARALFNNLLLVSLIILTGGAIISLIWSHRLTLPLERLSRATQEVGRGKFEIQLTPTSHDEIGNLTRSVNQMAFELRERDRALVETQAALIQSEKMSAFGQLSAGIAHEVKNPLAGILGYAQLSLKKTEDNPAIYKNLKIIEQETRRCNSIIENLMKFARQDKPDLKPLVLNDVIEDSLVLVDHQMGINHIQLQKSLADDLPSVRGDANQLIQVLMNILINAQQAMDGEPGNITVTSNSLDSGVVEIRITDTGPGMPEEVRQKIFEPFFTTKEAGKGTGLGMAVTYGIIKDHGGDIRIESELGKGTTFIITLPASTGAAVETESETREPSDDTQMTGEEAITQDLATEQE